MIDRLIALSGEYIKKYNDFPIATRNLSIEEQERLADFLEIVLQDNRQITEKEIKQYQDISKDIDI